MKTITVINDFINGNLKDARKGAEEFGVGALVRCMEHYYGYSENKARAVALWLKTGEEFQAACDAV